MSENPPALQRMSLKQHTIIFVPHARARFRKFRVTNRQLWALCGGLLLLTAASIFTTWAFLTNTIDRNELDAVRGENEELREINQSFETSIRGLEKQLLDFDERTRKLAIVAGIGIAGQEPEVGDGGIGGIGGAGYPYSESGAQDSLTALQSHMAGLQDEIDDVQAGLERQSQLTNSTPSVMPANGILTSRFGRRIDPVTRRPANHLGIDISTAPGRPVEATADGIVVRAERIGGLGNAVYLSHGYGVTTRYGHMSSIAVSAGDKVERGDVLGYVGSTGRSTGYHVHYEVRVNGRAQDPMIYILDRPTRR